MIWRWASSRNGPSNFPPCWPQPAWAAPNTRQHVHAFDKQFALEREARPRRQLPDPARVFPMAAAADAEALKQSKEIRISIEEFFCLPSPSPGCIWPVFCKDARHEDEPDRIFKRQTHPETFRRAMRSQAFPRLS